MGVRGMLVTTEFIDATVNWPQTNSTQMDRRWNTRPRIPRPIPTRPTTAAPSTESAKIFLVPADSAGDNVRELEPEEIQAENAHVFPTEHVVAVASLLAKVPKFPVDVLDRVLEYADLLVTFQALTRDEVRGQGDQNDVYLEMHLPTADVISLPPGVSIDPKCRELIAECSSHDQGWASQDNEFNGTYSASFTWSEVAVVKQVDGAPSEAARAPLSANVRVRRDYRHHLKHYVDPKGFVSNVEMGDTVQLIIRSQYPGWTNSANFGRLRARFALVFNEDAVLMSWDEIKQYASEFRTPTSVEDTL